MRTLVVLIAVVLSISAGCGGCEQVQIVKPAKYYRLTCKTGSFEDCTVNLPEVGTLSPKNDNGQDRIYSSTGEYTLNITGTGASFGTVYEINVNGARYVIDAGDATLLATNSNC